MEIDSENILCPYCKNICGNLDKFEAILEKEKEDKETLKGFRQ